MTQTSSGDYIAANKRFKRHSEFLAFALVVGLLPRQIFNPAAREDCKDPSTKTADSGEVNVQGGGGGKLGGTAFDGRL